MFEVLASGYNKLKIDVVKLLQKKKKNTIKGLKNF